MSPKDPRFALPEDVLLRCAALGTLLRCAADDGDRLWTVREVDPARVPEVEGLPQPALVSGTRPARPDLAWGEDSDVAAAANGRAFGIAVARELGVGPPGATMVASLAEIDALPPLPAWVLKAQHSAAGRGQFRFAPPLAGDLRRRAERLLDLHGALLAEPLRDLEREFGTVATVEGGRVGDVEVHEFGVDAGRSLAWIRAPAALDPRDRGRIADVARKVGERLGSLGYAGPFGTDARRTREGDFLALGEINARWTFGRVARETARRVLPGAAAWRFDVGTEAPPGAVRLLLPAPPDGVGAWISGTTASAP